MSDFGCTIFSPELSTNSREFEDLLKTTAAASASPSSSSGEIWKMKTKWGQELRVVLLTSLYTDAAGLVCGTMCAIMPLTAPAAAPGLHLDCDIPPLDDVQDIDTEEGFLLLTFFYFLLACLHGSLSSICQYDFYFFAFNQQQSILLFFLFVPCPSMSMKTFLADSGTMAYAIFPCCWGNAVSSFRSMENFVATAHALYGMINQCDVMSSVPEIEFLCCAEEQLYCGDESPRGSEEEEEEEGLVPPEQPLSPSSDGGIDGLEMFCDPGRTALHGSSVCSQGMEQ
jgi:hypothetical protein